MSSRILQMWISGSDILVPNGYQVIGSHHPDLVTVVVLGLYYVKQTTSKSHWLLLEKYREADNPVIPFWWRLRLFIIEMFHGIQGSVVHSGAVCMPYIYIQDIHTPQLQSKNRGFPKTYIVSEVTHFMVRWWDVFSDCVPLVKRCNICSGLSLFPSVLAGT